MVRQDSSGSTKLSILKKFLSDFLGQKFTEKYVNDVHETRIFCIFDVEKIVFSQ